MLYPLRWILPVGLLIGLGIGCTSDPTSGDMARQDQAMKDPFGYSPDMNRTDISGGGVGHFDQNGFGKDLNDVINP